MSQEGYAEIHGKLYKLVATRIREFRTAHPDYTVETEVLSNADSILMKAMISDETGRLLAVGHAEEARGSTNINKTSALENCETSALGRALSALGYGGDSYASAEEVANANLQLSIKAEQESIKLHMDAVKEHLETVVAVKQAIVDNNLGTAVEAMSEVNPDDQQALWRAPSKGSIWTTEERAVIKSDEWSEARNAHYNIGD